VLGLALVAGANGLWAQTTQAPSLIVPTTNLNFAYQVGQGAPAPAQTIRVFSNPQPVSFTATVQTTSGGGWLFVNSVTQYNGTTTATGSPDLAITVSPAGLPASTYGGTITITSGTSAVQINVNLVVSASPQLVITPASVPLQAVDANTTFSIPITIGSTNGTPLQFSALAESFTGLQITILPNSGTTPTTASIIVSPPITGTTTAAGVVRFTVPSTNFTVSVPISVQTSAPAQLQVTPTSVVFPYQIGGSSTPTAKSVQVSSSTQSQLTYSVAITGSTPGGPYVSLSGGSQSNSSSLTALTTPSSFSIIPNVASLPPSPAAGNYDTTLRVTASNGQTQDITARITVTTSPVLTVNPDALSFSFTPGSGVPGSQSITVNSTGQTQFYTATAVFATGAPQFFTVPTGQLVTPSPVPVTLNASVLAGLTGSNQTYTGTVHLVSQTISTAPAIDVPVTLTTGGSTGTAVLTVDDPTPAPFNGLLGAPQTARSTTVRSVNPVVPQSFTTSFDYAGSSATGWLVASPAAGTTPTVLIFNVVPSAITAGGSYTANIVLTPTAANSAPLRIPVTYNVTGAATVTATPARVDATQSGSTPPAQQSIQLTSTVTGLQYQPTTQAPSGDPIFVNFVNQGIGVIPGSLQFTFNSATLQPRTDPYVNNIVLVFNNGSPSVTIPVTLKVNASGTISVAPTTLNFTYQQATGATAPANQTLSLTSNGAAIPFTAAATTSAGGNWLSVTPTSGTTTASGGTATTLTVSISTANLPAGANTYNGTITVTPGNGSTAITVPVTLRVTVPNPPNNLVITNTASGLARGVSPGELITIKGSNMAPSVAVSFTPVNNAIPTRLGGVRVLFDNVEAPLIYVGPSGDKSSDQINAIVPYGVSGRAATSLVVEYLGVASQAVLLTVRQTDPGVFTANSQGSGPASLLNENNSYNAQSNPATPGSVVQIYGTGEGLLVPSQTTGTIVPPTGPFPSFLNSDVQVRINGTPATVTYAGAAPGLVAGVWQINAIVPTAINAAVSGTKDVSIDVSIGGTSSQPGATVWVVGTGKP